MLVVTELFTTAVHGLMQRNLLVVTGGYTHELKWETKTTGPIVPTLLLSTLTNSNHLAIVCVFQSCGNIYKGLAQSGAWGCFDEFNRISVEVLSVVAVQVKSIQDAIKDKKQKFNFLGEEITCIPTVGIFITMNPGYAGRTELPENLKALFRPCAMVVPDFELICEIMLVAEGFLEARLLARKFITLYSLCKELLSKQDHYDWGLRAIKSVLVVAGALKRGDPGRPEDQVRKTRSFKAFLTLFSLL